MANCTISTMEVNDCHLQFFDSNSKLIYEFNLNDTIALNNGAGILIKDDLTTLTIDKNIVVDNLETTVDALITYIQEQRVLCNCCATTPEAVVSSASWGYDSGGTLFYVKQMSDGSVVYNSPIGTVAAPAGNVTKTNPIINISSFVIIETTSSGNIGSGAFEFEIQNLTAVAGTINSINFAGNRTISGRAHADTRTDLFRYVPQIDYDALGATTFLITYLTP